MSISQKLTAVEAKLEEVKKAPEKIIIVASRELTKTERSELESHGYATYWEAKYKALKIPEIFAQFQTRFLVFELSQSDDAEYLGTSYMDLTGYRLVLLKKPGEDTETPWIKQFTEDFTFSIIETLDKPELIKDEDFTNYILNYHRVVQPDSCACLATVIPIVKAFLN